MSEPTPLRVRHGNRNAQNIYAINEDGTETFAAVAMSEALAAWFVATINGGRRAVVTPEACGRPRLFELLRDADVSGVSGTGRVAEGVIWSDGEAAIHWLGRYPTTTPHPLGIVSVKEVHGHSGSTRIVLNDPADRLARIAEAHVKEVIGGGMTSGCCVECGHLWPCPSYVWSTASDRDPTLDCWDPADDVAANTLDRLKDWSSVHTLVIRDLDGEHYLKGYEQPLTERQTWESWDGDTHVVFEPVELKVKMVEVVEWVRATPADLAPPSLEQRAERAEAAVARARATTLQWHRDARKFCEQIPQRDRPEWAMVAAVCAAILAALDGEEADR